MTLGEKLKEARQVNHLTQEEVAEKLFVTRQAISKWEQNKTLPNIYVLKDLSQLYQVDIQHFLSQTEEETVEKKHLNILALFGALCFNLFIFIAAFLATLLLLFILYLISFLFISFPFMILLMILLGFSNDLKYSNRSLFLVIFLSLVFFVIGAFLLPLTIKMTKVLWHLFKKYIRYHTKTIYY